MEIYWNLRSHVKFYSQLHCAVLVWIQGLKLSIHCYIFFLFKFRCYDKLWLEEFFGWNRPEIKSVSRRLRSLYFHVFNFLSNFKQFYHKIFLVLNIFLWLYFIFHREHYNYVIILRFVQQFLTKLCIIPQKHLIDKSYVSI